MYVDCHLSSQVGQAIVSPTKRLAGARVLVAQQRFRTVGLGSWVTDYGNGCSILL